MAERNQHVIVKQYCLTKAHLDKVMPHGQHHQDCNSKAVSQNGEEWVTEMVCSGKFTATGEIRIHATDAEHMTRQHHDDDNKRDEREPMKSGLESKWLGTDCSAVTS